MNIETNRKRAAMKFASNFTFLLLFFLLAACAPAPADDDSETGEGRDSLETPAGHEEPGFTWELSQNDDYHFQLEAPASWQTFRTEESDAFTILNYYHNPQNIDIELPIAIHVDAAVSHVSFYPEGYGTELPFSSQKTFSEMKAEPPVGFPVDTDESIAFMLENGEVWGYLLRPASSVENWEDSGFLFAQIAIENFETKCFDEETGNPLPPEECDPMTGDSVAYHGNTDKYAKTAVFHILKTLEFTETGEQKTPVPDLLQVESPLPNQSINSPVTIKGKARGTWYFEGSFPVVLLDKDNQILAEGNAKAQGDWMTEDWVPFELTLEFDTPGEERGAIKFKKANPSGMPAKARAYEQPVIFGPESRNAD